MKKHLIMIVGVVLIINFCGCGNTNVTNNDNSIETAIVTSPELTSDSSKLKEESIANSSAASTQPLPSSEPSSVPISSSAPAGQEMKQENHDQLEWVDVYLKEAAKLHNINNEAKFDLILFDNDDTPELIASVDNDWTSLYTCQNGEILCLIDQGNAWHYSYIPRMNNLYQFIVKSEDNTLATTKNYQVFSYFENGEMKTKSTRISDYDGNVTEDSDYDYLHSSFFEEDYYMMEAAFSYGQFLRILSQKPMISMETLFTLRWKLVYQAFLYSEFPKDALYTEGTKFYPFDANNDGIPELYCDSLEEQSSVLCTFNGANIDTFHFPHLEKATDRLNDTVFYGQDTGSFLIVGLNPLEVNQAAVILDYLKIEHHSFNIIGKSEVYLDADGNEAVLTSKWDNEDIDYETYMNNVNIIMSETGTNYIPIPSTIAFYDRDYLLLHYFALDR